MELKPCPFCGCVDTLDPNDQFGGQKPYAVCCWGTDDGKDGCGYMGPEAVTKGEAITAWNRRPNEHTALQEAVLRAAVEDRLTRPLLQEGVWDWTPDSEQKRLDAAVDALLAAEPAWGEGR